MDERSSVATRCSATNERGLSVIIYCSIIQPSGTKETHPAAEFFPGAHPVLVTRVKANFFPQKTHFCA